MRIRLTATLMIASLALTAAAAVGQQVEPEEFILDNGMTFLLLPRDDQPNSISAGWVAKVGSVNERPGITGLSHFFEHLMFKGTSTIGTRDPGLDAELMRKQEAVKQRIHELVWTEQYARAAAGEIDDPWDPANDTEELRSLRQELNDLIEAHAAIIEKDEFSAVYTRFGGSGMNAFTSYDMTFYFITVPSNKFELWAWMESDRLTDSVFREFYAERDVVHEERRLRVESTPTGELAEQFDAMFWQSSPYGWPVIGWPSDLNSYTLEEAKRYFRTYYAPNNLVGIVVGDFDPAAVKPVIREYFSRLSRGPEAPPVVTREIPQLAEKRLVGECDCQPQVEVRYHTVPFNHADSFPLQVMSEILNGRTGRLYKSMVEGRGIASSASTSTNQLGGAAKYAGSFSFYADVKGDATPEMLEEAWYAELDRLQNEPVGERELQKVKNRFQADAYRRLQSNFFLLLQLGVYEALGAWEYINTSPKQFDAVTAADVQRVAKTYFDSTNRCVAVFRRKAGTQEDPELAALPAEMRGPIKQQVAQLQSVNDPAMLQAFLQRFESSDRSALPPGQRAALEYLAKKIRERLEVLQTTTPAPGSAPAEGQ